MKGILRIASLAVLLAGLAVWAATGFNLGWSKTKVAIRRVDPVTEIEYQEFQNRFVAGLDFLAVTWLAAGSLAGASLFFGNRKPSRPLDAMKKPPTP